MGIGHCLTRISAIQAQADIINGKKLYLPPLIIWQMPTFYKYQHDLRVFLQFSSPMQTYKGIKS